MIERPERPAQPKHLHPGYRRALLLGKNLGLLGFLGGMAAIASMRWFGPAPADAAQWKLLIGLMRAVFFPCVFAGVIVVVLCGVLLFARLWRQFLAMRWFRVKLVVLLVALPALHLWSRTRVREWYALVDANRLDEALAAWHDVGLRFTVALAVLLPVAALAKVKPRLGQPFGRIPPLRRDGRG